MLVSMLVKQDLYMLLVVVGIIESQLENQHLSSSKTWAYICSSCTIPGTLTKESQSAHNKDANVLKSLQHYSEPSCYQIWHGTHLRMGE